jgi:ribonuclease HI
MKKTGIGMYIPESVSKYYSLISGNKCKVKDVNAAELSAIYVGLLINPSNQPIEVYSDSITAINLLENKLYNKKFNTLVSCIKYVSIVKYKNNVQYVKVKGHSGVYGNEMAHNLAREGASSDHIFYMPESNKTNTLSLEDIMLENIYKNSLLHDNIFFL